MKIKDVLTVNGIQRIEGKIELDNLSQRSPVQWKITDDLQRIIKEKEEFKKDLKI